MSRGASPASATSPVKSCDNHNDICREAGRRPNRACAVCVVCVQKNINSLNQSAGFDPSNLSVALENPYCRGVWPIFLDTVGSSWLHRAAPRAMKYRIAFVGAALGVVRFCRAAETLDLGATEVRSYSTNFAT